MKLFRKKAQNRKVFGFQCDQGLAQGVRLTAKAIEFPIYVVAEHVVQIGLTEIMPLLNDEKARADLDYHLRADHLLQKNLSKPISNYDERFLSAKRQDVIRNRIEEKKGDVDVQDAAHYLFSLAKMFDIKPIFLVGFVQHLLLSNKYPEGWAKPYNPTGSDDYSRNGEQVSENEELPDDDDREEE